MAIPFLLSAASRLVTSQMAKKAAKEGVKRAAKKFVKGKKKEKVKSKGGALVKRAKVSQGKTQQRVSYQKLLNTSKNVGSVDTVQQKTSYESLTKTMQGIVKTTTQLDKTLKKQLLIDKKKVDNKKKVTSAKKKKQREEKLEKRRLNLGGIGSAAMGVANKFNIIDFFTNILLGGLILWMIKNVDKMKSTFKLLENNIYASFLILRGGLQAIKGVLKFAIKAPFKLVATVGRKIGKVAGGVLKGIKSLGGAILRFARNQFRRFRGLPPIDDPKSKGSKGPPGAGTGTYRRPGTSGFRGPGRYRLPGQAAAGGFDLEQARNKASQFKPTPKKGPLGRLNSARRGFGASLETGTAFGGKGSRLQRSTVGTFRRGKKLAKAGNVFLEKLFGIFKPDDIQKLKNSAPVLKKAGRVVRGVPIVGPLIVFTTSVLSSEPVGQAAFKAIGAGLGEFLGTFIPIPGLGTIIGGLIGEVMGDAAYSLIIKKNPKEAQKKIFDAVGEVAKVGGKILDWMKGVVGRFWEALPKMKLPEWTPFGLGGMEILDPKMLANPLFMLGSMGKAMITALFQPSKEEKGKVDDKSDVNEGEESSRGPLPATTMEGDERELLLKLMVAEAGGEGRLGMAAVARSVLNRAGLIQSGKVTPDTFGALSGSIFDVISAPDQYSPYNNGLPSITEAQRREAIRALALAENTAGLRATLEGKSMPASDINNIVKSTGFRRHDAGYDQSQDVNPTPLGDHIFNTAGNTGMVAPTASISQAQISGSAVERAGQTTGTNKNDLVSGFPVTSGYGATAGRSRPHGGIDIGTPVGTFVALSVPVEIVYAGNNGDYGYVIDAWAPSLGLQFRLAHLNEFLVTKGQTVSAGTALGKTGGAKGDRRAGSSSGPHLHFEVDNRKNGTTYGGLGNPSPYVQYLILSSNGPRAGASVTTPGAVARRRVQLRVLSGLASYEQGAENTIYVPSQQQQQTVVAGGGSSPVIMAASTRDVVNSYYKQQLLGFLYKQG
tara:strand:+ start:256 stop:3249 length:2994 start_codon:yes stop_codon:yes gene_type:complete